MNSIAIKQKVGRPYPLGATVDELGVNFSVFSENAEKVELLLFDRHDTKNPFASIELDPNGNRTNHFWHVYVEGIKEGIHYAYRVDGPQEVNEGYRFDRDKVLIDPYALGNTNTLWDRGNACKSGDNVDTSMRSVVINPDNYDWEGDEAPLTPMKDSIIYEMHVRGFTKSSTSDVNHKGTFKGVIEKIPYLKELGVTAVELLPVFDFDEKDIYKTLDNGEQLKNYWGYSTLGYFAPEESYCVEPASGSHLDEFRDMVKALHRAGIEVILDVVFNHTDEGNHEGPIFSFKGFDNKVYYDTVAGDRQYYMDYTGCGNTLNCNHPVVEKFITDSLKFWVKEMHVDGFRFDEGSVLSRGEDGKPLKYPPVLWNIDLDEEFEHTKLIAEAWDAGGLYQVGSFPGYRWAEWNGQYRDSVRRFVKGDGGLIGEIAARIAGSADIYEHSRHTPNNSINFITCHDGFTMMDLVSYNEKHNEQNGEDNRDGMDENFSWNCGVEGETDEKSINQLRKQQIKNYCTILMLSQGIPMILAGDEVGRTQRGNNNAYCQDNDISWFNWNMVEQNLDLFHFFKNMIAFRKDHEILRRGRFFDGFVNSRGLKDIDWHGCELHAPGWQDKNSRVLSFTMGALKDADTDIHVMMNMENEQSLSFKLPQLNRERTWHRFVDTSLESPDDIVLKGEEIVIEGVEYEVNPHSVVILISK
ncbi:glycogen debranching protein GlgX [Bacillus solimangrovi]|uniref:Glycogen debranching enzyme GlgX n=1 Tax=Bacillus solimangrovi TaxID=1305675 RepID=A0A1E5LIC2_9BACI|nr:glycogen debranching protein GlgX [Bacillus solimangrovi]OEH93832.1 glycogen debranching enzyme GlgX [Bacillus solimangrovi]